jgi:hypothetical protein
MLETMLGKIGRSSAARAMRMSPGRHPRCAEPYRAIVSLTNAVFVNGWGTSPSDGPISSTGIAGDWDSGDLP